MEAFYKCCKVGCRYPGCDKLMKVSDRIVLDRDRNPLYTAICHRTGDVVDGIRELELIHPPKRTSATECDWAKMVDDCAKEIDASIDAIKSGDRNRCDKIDPTQPPLITGLYPLTEEFVFNSTTDEDWHLMQTSIGHYQRWMSKFSVVEQKLSELFAEIEKAFPNLRECVAAQRACKLLIGRISYQGVKDYLAGRLGYDKRSIAEFNADFQKSLSELSDRIREKDKPTTRSGRKRHPPAQQKRGPKTTSEQERQKTTAYTYLKNHPKAWTAAAGHALAGEIARRDNGIKTDGYIAKAKDHNLKTATESLAQTLRREAKADGGHKQ